MKVYDVIVIGGGGAGLSAAFTTAGFGRRTLLVEKNKVGGECTWNGCIPSKALLNIAGKPEIHRQNKDPFDVVREVREAVYAHETPEVLAERGVETLIGEARFIARNRIEVNGEILQAKYFVLAVGSRALIPPIPGLKTVPCLTNESLFELKELPRSMLILGGGPIGLEMAQALGRLGVDITVVEVMERILIREDPDAAEVIRERLTGEGISLLTGAKAVGVRSGAEGITLTVETGGARRDIEAETLLVAVGRGSAAQNLNLEIAGVKGSAKGVAVNRFLRTSNRRIYAAGDTAGPYAFSHMAEYQGVKAALNILLPFKSAAKYSHVPWCTFTDPEIARTGMTEEEARKAFGRRCRVYIHRFEDTDRGRTAPGTAGLVKIILGPGNRIAGAHIAGPRAGELISEIQVLKTLRIPYHKLTRVIHPYPSYADILRIIAKKAAMDRILEHPVVRVFRKGVRSGR